MFVATVPPALGVLLEVVDGDTGAEPLVGAEEGEALEAVEVIESMTLCGIVTPAPLQRETAKLVVAVVFEPRLVSRETAARGGLHIHFSSSELHFPDTQLAILEINFESEQMHLMSPCLHAVDCNPWVAHEFFQEAISILAYNIEKASLAAYSAGRQ